MFSESPAMLTMLISLILWAAPIEPPTPQELAPPEKRESEPIKASLIEQLLSMKPTHESTISVKGEQLFMRLDQDGLAEELWERLYDGILTRTTIPKHSPLWCSVYSGVLRMRSVPKIRTDIKADWINEGFGVFIDGPAALPHDTDAPIYAIAGKLDVESHTLATLGWTVRSRKPDGSWRSLGTIERGKDGFAWTDDVLIIPKEDLLTKGDQRVATLRTECWITDLGKKTRVKMRETERTFSVAPSFAAIKKPMKSAAADTIVGSIKAVIEQEPQEGKKAGDKERGMLRLDDPFIAQQKLAEIGIDTLAVRLSLRLAGREIWSRHMWWGRVPPAWRSGDTHNFRSGLSLLTPEVCREILRTNDELTLTISGSRDTALRDVVGRTYWDGEARIPITIKPAN
jgi:hypothetical protein